MGLEVKLINNQKKVMKKLDDIQKKRLFEAITFVKTATLKKLSGNRTGRVYRKPYSKVTYRASAPGEPPARPTGDLVRSIRTEVKKTLKGFFAVIGSNLKKAPALEFGTPTIAPRPFIKPSITENLGKIKRILGRKWK
jgi:hypothetical protein